MPLMPSSKMVATEVVSSGESATDAGLCTPRRHGRHRQGASPFGAISSPVLNAEHVKSMTTPTASARNAMDIKRKRQTGLVAGKLPPTPVSATKNSAKKRARRVSMGTPGKAVPLDPKRAEHVNKSFRDHEVSEVYRAIRRQTGALGGNAAGGAIYGEITQNSFQRVVDFMKEHCELSERSLFLDVGSGLGKPNFHVAIDPGVEVSYGVELEELRWHLSLHNLKHVLSLDINKQKTNRIMFSAGDITHAHTLNPFSHVYSFDVGFPPAVMDQLADIFNRSKARYYVSFHTPRKLVETYGFHVENIGRVATSMAGSNEGHTCYFYRRVETEATTSDEEVEIIEPTACDSEGSQQLYIDPLFRVGFDVLRRGKDGVLAWVVSFFGQQVYGGRTRRQKAQLDERKSQVRQKPLEAFYRVVGKPRDVGKPEELSGSARKKLRR